MKKLDYPEPIRTLISQFKRLPGIGPKSAERMAIWLLRSSSNVAGELAVALATAAREITTCPQCGFFSTGHQLCEFCADTSRDVSMLCVVEHPTDILPLERTGAFHGQFHVLGGRISPLENVSPEDLNIEDLYVRIRRDEISEVILALGSDVEGEATANYLADAMRSYDGVKITRIAQGLPAGGGLESADELTLYRALSGRRNL